MDMNFIFDVFESIYEVGHKITIFGFCDLWVFLFSLIVIWVLLSAFLSFVRSDDLHSANERYERKQRNNKR